MAAAPFPKRLFDSLKCKPIARKSLAYALLAVVVAMTTSRLLVDASFDVRHDVQFELHTREHGVDTYEELQTDQYGRTDRDPTMFDAARPTRIYVHGFRSSRRAYLRYARAFLKNADCNFIAVNWLNGSKTYNYFRARGRVERVSTVPKLHSVDNIYAIN